MAVRLSGGALQVDGGITRVFQLPGKRWTGVSIRSSTTGPVGPIVAVLTGGSASFLDLRRAIPGASERMLSDRLTELAAAGCSYARWTRGRRCGSPTG